MFNLTHQTTCLKCSRNCNEPPYANLNHSPGINYSLLCSFFPDLVLTVEKKLNLFVDKDSDQETLSDLVQFWTCSPALPTLSQKLTVVYKVDDNLLPEANTCPMILAIPIGHSTYESFREYLDKAISFAKGFGKM